MRKRESGRGRWGEDEEIEGVRGKKKKRSRGGGKEEARDRVRKEGDGGGEKWER